MTSLSSPTHRFKTSTSVHFKVCKFYLKNVKKKCYLCVFFPCLQSQQMANVCLMDPRNAHFRCFLSSSNAATLTKSLWASLQTTGTGSTSRCFSSSRPLTPQPDETPQSGVQILLLSYPQILDSLWFME